MSKKALILPIEKFRTPMRFNIYKHKGQVTENVEPIVNNEILVEEPKILEKTPVVEKKNEILTPRISGRRNALIISTGKNVDNVVNLLKSQCTVTTLIGKEATSEAIVEYITKLAIGEHFLIYFNGNSRSSDSDELQYKDELMVSNNGDMIIWEQIAPLLLNVRTTMIFQSNCNAKLEDVDEKKIRIIKLANTQFVDEYNKLTKKYHHDEILTILRYKYT